MTPGTPRAQPVYHVLRSGKSPIDRKLAIDSRRAQLLMCSLLPRSPSERPISPAVSRLPPALGTGSVTPSSGALGIVPLVDARSESHGFWPARGRNGSSSVDRIFRPRESTRREYEMVLMATLNEDITLPGTLPMISKTGETRLSFWLEDAMISQEAQFDGIGFGTPSDTSAALISGAAHEAATA